MDRRVDAYVAQPPRSKSDGLEGAVGRATDAEPLVRQHAREGRPRAGHTAHFFFGYRG